MANKIQRLPEISSAFVFRTNIVDSLFAINYTPMEVIYTLGYIDIISLADDRLEANVIRRFQKTS